MRFVKYNLVWSGSELFWTIAQHYTNIQPDFCRLRSVQKQFKLLLAFNRFRVLCYIHIVMEFLKSITDISLNIIILILRLHDYRKVRFNIWSRWRDMFVFLHGTLDIRAFSLTHRLHSTPMHKDQFKRRDRVNTFMKKGAQTTWANIAACPCLCPDEKCKTSQNIEKILAIVSRIVHSFTLDSK